MSLPAVAATPAARMPWPRRLLDLLWRVWDRLAIYLPLVLMALLALLTYWMVRIAPQLSEPEEFKPRAHEVDFFMRGATMKSYDPAGRLQSQLTGTEIRHYADNATVEIDQPRWQSVGPDGRITQGRARRALSKDDGSEVQLIGEAVVVREAFARPGAPVLPRQEFRSEFLHIFADDERVNSPRPVQFISGDDQFSADSFRYDHLSRVVELEGRVRARISGRTATGVAPR